jgi:hypothetical protein
MRENCRVQQSHGTGTGDGNGIGDGSGIGVPAQLGTVTVRIGHSEIISDVYIYIHSDRQNQTSSTRHFMALARVCFC